MKHLFTLIIASLFSCAVWAQTPQSFRYQAVARDNSGKVLSNQSVSFRISILSGSVSGTVAYSETHTSLTTNAFGLVELEIGKGTPVTGFFSSIDWGINSYFVKVEMDPTGGSTYQPLITSQLLSVPYALHAKTVEQISDNTVTSVKIADGSIATADLADNSVTSAKITDGTIAAIDVASNAITTVKVANGTITSEKIADGTITGAKIAQQSATSGQVLKWNGISWQPGEGLSLPYNGNCSSDGAAFSINQSGTGSGIYVFNPNTSGSNSAITATSNSASGVGVSGYISSETGSGTGVLGSTNSPSGIGVKGISTSLEGTNYGITGETKSPEGIGVWGNNTATWGIPYGVKGSVSSASGFSGFFTGGKFSVLGNVGIGTTSPSAKLEVAGQVKITGGSPGSGKVLTSDDTGLASWESPGSGLTLPYTGSVSTTGDQAFSIWNTGTGNGIFVRSNMGNGLVSQSNGGVKTSGLMGLAYGTGENYGVSGSSNSSSGTGVSGSASSLSGATIGVSGLVFSPDGYSGHFEGGKFYVSGNAGIGVTAPSAKLDVNGQLKIRGGSPGSGKVLTSDASGLASWQTPAPGFDLPLHREIASDGYVLSISNNSTSAEVPKIGIIGSSDLGTGIYGSTGAGSREFSGVMGVSTFIGSTGVYGKAVSTSGSGVGVIGESSGDTGTGMYGNGYLHGVKGEGNKFGIRGIASGSSGIGIEGNATSETGETYGVVGKVISPLGFSGYFEGGVFYVSSNAGFGINEPTAKVDIQGQIKIRGGSPEVGKVLTCSNSTGLATWQVAAAGTFSSSGGITSNSLTTDHFVVGSLLMDDIIGTGDDIRLFFNKTKGAFRAGRNSSSDWNDALVGQYSAAFGDNNKASGSGSFASGVASVASGNVATAIGYYANATAMISTAVGSYNVGLGTADSWISTDPVFEIGNGTSVAARSNAFTVLKNGNTGIGTHTPSQKLHIKGSAAGNAVLFIEPNKWTSTGDYGELRFGDVNHYIRGEHTKGMTFNDANKFSFLGGNVGIGHDNPAAKLDVSASQGPNIIIRDSDGGAGRPGIQFINNDIHFIGADDTSTEIFGIYSIYGNNRTNAARLNIYAPATDNWGKYIGLTHDGNNGRVDTDAGYLVLQPAGNRVGIGTDAPSQSLDVNGNARFRSIASDAYYGVLNRKSDGTLTTATSDIRLKENIENLDNSLEKVMQLRGVSFTWKTNPEYGTRIGFIAQEFEKVIPELVFTNETDGYKGINYAEVTAVLVEAIKELKTENDLLKKRLEQIEALMEFKAEK